jgi:hypothetical protein
VAPDVRSAEYAGHDSVRLEAGDLRAYVATSFGPRVVGLEAGDSGNLFAELPDAWLPVPGGERFRFRGGHRLWAAPEHPATTYRPDDAPVDVAVSGAGVRVTGPVDPVTGLRRSLELRAGNAGDSILEVRHVIRNAGAVGARLAPWAITQLPVGGLAWLPLGGTGAAAESPLPDRLLVLWPYTDLRDPRLRLANGAVEIAVRRRRGGGPHRLKLGASGRGGRLAYLRRGWLFEKRHDAPRSDVPDLGAAAQVYADERFVELETLGQLVDLAPGQEVAHVETWHVSRATADQVRERTAAG